MQHSMLIFFTLAYIKYTSAFSLADLSLVQYAGQALQAYSDFQKNDAKDADAVIAKILREMTPQQITEVTNLLEGFMNTDLKNFEKDMSAFGSFAKEVLNEEGNQSNMKLNAAIPINVLKNMQTYSDQIKGFMNAICNKSMVLVNDFSNLIQTMTFVNSKGDVLDIQSQCIAKVRLDVENLVNVVPAFRTAIININECMVNIQQGANSLGQSANSAYGNIENICSELNADLTKIETAGTNIINSFSKYQLVSNGQSSEAIGLSAILSGFGTDAINAITAILDMNSHGPALKNNLQTLMANFNQY